jgi:8-oxo-dGTP pyrophosphatase MutT (NUDIX family)
MEVGADERPWDRKGRAASIAFVTGDGRVLLVKRSAKDDHKPGEWCLPGGKAEGDEGFYNCALREAGEEVGTDGWEDEGGRELLRTRTPNDWEHVTYAIPVRDAFVPRLSDEHDDWTWAHPDALPDPVHPGVKKCVDGVILDGRAEDVENPEGRLSATTREDISAGRRKSMPESAFLEPARRKYPVQELRDGKWTYTCALLLAAGRRARMEGGPKLAARADAIRAREFPEAADGEFREGDHPRRSDGKFGSGGGGPPSGTEHLKKAYEEGSVPEGWYTHGRAMRQDLKTGNVIQSTRDLDVSHQYAGSKGSVWYLRPKADARTLDLSGTSSGDIGRVADAAVEDYESGKLPWADDFDNSRDLRGLSREEKADALREVVEESFSPGNIVDSAGAYDNPDWTKWLKKRFKVDFVHVPDGSVTINPKAVEAVKVRGAEDVADPDRRVIGKPGTPSEREPTPEGALDGFDAIARVLDLALDGAADGLAFDALLGLAEDKEPERWKDDVGRMHISDSVISKAVVSPYLGKEINRVMEGEEGWVPLEAERTYRLLRHPDELRKAAKTFQGLPIVWKHVPTSAEDHPTDIVVGATGTNAKFDGTDLTNDLVFWPKYAVEAVEDESKKNLSCGYGYKADMTPGSYDGHDYDGIMRDLVGNHLAQVERPRVPGSKVGGDEASEDGFDRLARILAAA